MSWQERGGQSETQEEEKERSPSEFVEHAVIRDESGHGQEGGTERRRRRGEEEQEDESEKVRWMEVTQRQIAQKALSEGIMSARVNLFAPSSHPYSHFLLWGWRGGNIQ